MKKLKKLTLNQIADVQLQEDKMCRILGGAPGDPCQCGCEYAGSGGSSTSSNNSANVAGGLHSGNCPTPPTPPKQSNCSSYCLPIEENQTHPQDALCPPGHGNGYF